MWEWLIGASALYSKEQLRGCRTRIRAVSYWYSTSMVILSADEARDLVKTILEAVEAAEDRTQVRASWSLEATDWCYLLLDRLAEGDQ